MRSELLHVRGRRVARAGGRRHEMRCEGYCGAVLSAPLTPACPRQATATHTRNTGHAKPVDEAERCSYAIKRSLPGLRRYRGGSG